MIENPYSYKAELPQNRRYYHGTTDLLPIGNTLLPPSKTGYLREDFRRKLHDVVFLTDSLMSAEGYAKKAVMTYGGNPCVYEVEPVGEVTKINDTQYICDEALIKNKLT